MKTRFIGSRALVHSRLRGIRWRSSIHARQNGRFSIITGPSTPKQAVLDYITANGSGSLVKTRHAVSTRESNAAVILASLDMASWLEDTSFISELLRRCSFNHSNDTSEPAEVSVLAAVVDGLCPRRPHGCPVSGLSLMHGPLDTVLPGLWDSEGSPMQPAVDRQSSISVALDPLLGDFRSLTVTVPLANTVFQNGRRSTLLASRWTRNGVGQYDMSNMVEKQSQAIIPSLKSIQTHTCVSVPLLPVTRPRKILTGLGNIVRQLDINGEAVPSSTELESIIPQVLEARLRASLPSTAGPVAAWALVIPREVMNSAILKELSPPDDYKPVSDGSIAATVSRCFSDLLAAGCHVHKILSGGGGWGLKQGLLSLDPQIRYTADDEQDIDSFINAFKGEEAAEGIVTPGSYIQFYLEPATLESTPIQTGEQASWTPCSPSLIFGTHHGGTEQRPLVQEEAVEVIEDHFGAISSQGLYIDSWPESSVAVDEGYATHTKIDAPRSYIWDGPKRWM